MQPVSSDRPGAGNAASPPLIPSGTRRRGPLSMPARRHGASPLTREARSQLREGASEPGPGIALRSIFPTTKPKILELLITPD